MNIKKNIVLILFSKEPEVGKVKTRLIPALGEQGACLLYNNFLKHSINELKHIKNADFMVYTTKLPDNESSQSFFSNTSRHFQKGENLGEKMYNCLHEQLKSYNKAILLGADCPAINSQMIKYVIRMLDSYQHVFVPVIDGGYSLIGTKNVNKELFSDISWGTSKVMEETLLKLDKLKQSYNLLPEQYDIDTIDDLLRLQKDPQLGYLTDTMELKHE